MARFFARSASDKTTDWPFYFVADRKLGGLNRTAEIIRQLVDPAHSGGVLVNKKTAVRLAEIANLEWREVT